LVVVVMGIDGGGDVPAEAVLVAMLAAATPELDVIVLEALETLDVFEVSRVSPRKMKNSLTVEFQKQYHGLSPTLRKIGAPSEPRGTIFDKGADLLDGDDPGA